MVRCLGRRRGGDKPTAGRLHARHMINLATTKRDTSDKGTNEPGGDGERLNLKRHVRNKLLLEIFDKGINERQRTGLGQGQKRHLLQLPQRSRSFGLYVLIVDVMGAEILNACMKMTELGQRRIALVEKLELARKPLANMEAIYVIKPDEESVLRLIEDFRDRESALYKCAHVFFTRKLLPIYFDAIAGSPIAPFIHTMKELYVGFIPEESQVFNLNMPDNLYDMYSPTAIPALQQTAVDIMTEKILSLCQTIHVYPQIRYQSSPTAFSIALLLSRKLDAYNQSVSADLSRDSKPGENVLLVLERGVDAVTALLHSMTLEALVRDILPIENGYYEFTSKNAHDEVIQRVVKLDETEDELWDDIRHNHIADAANGLPVKYAEFLQKNRMIRKDNPTVEDMSTILKAFPEYHKELSQFALHMDLSKKCMRQLRGGLMDIVRAEQNIATGKNVHTNKVISSYMPELAPFLTEEGLEVMVKIRLMMLYVLIKNGSPESDIDKIFDCADIPLKYKTYIINMSFLGLNILTRRRVTQNRPPVKERSMIGKYETGRWTPYVMDLVEDILDGTLRKDGFPIIETEKHNAKIEPVGEMEAIDKLVTEGHREGQREGQRLNQSLSRLRQPQQHHHHHHHHSPVKRIIICFVGGVTFAEMQSAHQIAAEKGVEVLIGGDDIITPEIFMERVRRLRRWSALDDSPDYSYADATADVSRDVSIDGNLHHH